MLGKQQPSARGSSGPHVKLGSVGDRRHGAIGLQWRAAGDVERRGGARRVVVQDQLSRRT